MRTSVGACQRGWQGPKEVVGPGRGAEQDEELCALQVRDSGKPCQKVCFTRQPSLCVPLDIFGGAQGGPEDLDASLLGHAAVTTPHFRTKSSDARRAVLLHLGRSSTGISHDKCALPCGLRQSL